MKYIYTILAPFLYLVLISTGSEAQLYTNTYIHSNTNMYNTANLNRNSYTRYNNIADRYSSRMTILRSDFSTKSALVSSIREDIAGDMSPIIGAATWNDKGNLFQCRSLLEFDFSALPVEVLNNPWLITSAELILYPVDVKFSPDDQAKKSNLLVRQVLEDWEDFSTSWINQPFTDKSREISKIIKLKNKNEPVEVNVTDFVKEMIAYENNGFMIYNNTPKQSMASGQLFSSPKNEDPSLRPQLVIKYKDLIRYRRGIEYYTQYYGSGNYWNEQQTATISRKNSTPTRQISTGPASAPVNYHAPTRTIKPTMVTETNKAATRTKKTNNN